MHNQYTIATRCIAAAGILPRGCCLVLRTCLCILSTQPCSLSCTKTKIQHCDLADFTDAQPDMSELQLSSRRVAQCLRVNVDIFPLLAHIGMPCSGMILHRPQDIAQRRRVCRVCYHVLHRGKASTHILFHNHQLGAELQYMPTKFLHSNLWQLASTPNRTERTGQHCTLSCCTAFGRHPTSMKRIFGLSCRAGII